MSSLLRRQVAFGALPWGWFIVRDLHWFADAVALGLPVLVVSAVAAGLVLSVLRRRFGPLVIATSWSLFGLAVIVGPWTPLPGSSPIDPVRIVGANTYGSVPEPRSIGDDIMSQAPDIVVVGELGPEVREDLEARFRSSVVGPDRAFRRPDVAVFSALPLERLELPAALRPYGVRVRIARPPRAFVLYGLHLPPPRARPTAYTDISVARHRELVRVLRDAVLAEEGPVVVAGDLNLVDRASGYRLLTGNLDDAMRSGWVRPTARRPVTVPLLARVDHVLVTETWCSAHARIFELTGSDHNGVAVDVGRCRS